jgi:aarF domain-containing kinase
MKGLRLGILDWGQTKALDPHLKHQLARLLLAMSHYSNTPTNEDEGGREGGVKLQGSSKSQRAEEMIKREFYRLGIVTEKEDEASEVCKMVFSMFDTRVVEDYCGNPFDKSHALHSNAVLSFPSDLCYVLRTVQILRGMSVGMGVDFDLTKVWAPMAEGYLKREAGKEKGGKGEEGREEVVDFRRKVTI